MVFKERKHWGVGLSVQRKGLIVVGVPVLMQLLLFTALFLLVGEEVQRMHQDFHKRYMQENMEVMLVRSMNIGLSLVRYRFFHDPQYLADYRDNVDQINKAMSELQAAAQRDGNLHEIELVNKVRADTDRLVKVGEEAKALCESNAIESMGATPKLKHDLSHCVHDLETDVREFEAEEMSTGVEDPDKFAKDGVAKEMTLVAAALSLEVIAAFAMMMLFNDGLVSRLKVLKDNTFRLAKSEVLLPPLDGSDEIAHLDRVFHDMANALAEAAHKERAIVQNAADVICSIDADGSFSRVSPASLQVFGYAPEELMGRRYTQIVQPEDVAAAEAEFKRIMEEETEPQPFETRVVRNDGVIVYVLWSAYWAPSEQSMFCVAHDITERKKAEDQLRASEARVRSIFESAPVALVVIDEQGRIKLANPRAEKMFGYPVHDLIDRHVSLLLPKSADFEASKLSQATLKEMIGHVRDVDAQTRSGYLFPVEFTLEHYETAEGQRFLAAMLDVSERQEIERLKREFVSTVSHELRTPLTAIRGSLTLLSVGAMGKLSDQADKVVKIAERNSLRLINLINDLLDIEKLEAGKLEMVFEEAPFNAIVERSLESVRAFAEQYQVNLQAEKTDAQVCADGDRLVQVLVNLISNAVKYSPRQGTVSLRMESADQWLRVSIVDRGRGIPADYLDKVFERFQQVESADSKKKGGTGLGLAICKAIVEQHNGEIGVDSQEGQGSTFWFRIPLSGSPAALTLGKQQPALTQSSVGNGQDATVTIADDADTNSDSGSADVSNGGLTIRLSEAKKVTEERS